MTLSTDLVILDPMSARAVFDFALALVADGFPSEPTWDYTRKGEGDHYKATTSHYATTCGQGLPAWLFVHHGDDGPLTLVEDDWEADEPVPPCNEHFIRIDWDTGYSYRGASGEGCGDLHARYVATVGRWLDEQGKRWWWRNEFTGEWHEGCDGLESLGNAGDEAMSWFVNTVRPAIESGLIR